jgi:CubicO group peptidase (beta-lactamase class C family)
MGSKGPRTMPPANAPRIWLRPSDKAKPTVTVCRSLLAVCFAVTVTVFLNEKEQRRQETQLLVYVAALATLVLCILVGCQGPRWSLIYRILGVGPAPQLFYRRTYIKPGYEPVAEAFAETLAEGRETGMQFCAFVNGEMVIDLAGSIVEKQGRNWYVHYDNESQLSFDSDIYSTVWSSSKVITSIVMAWLVDQGHLDYHAKIKDYWPEFTGGGKENLTVEQLLKHNAGLALPPPFTLRMEDLFPENLPKGRASEILEGMTCRFPPEWTKLLAYHGVTRGWFLNEIARRVDPKKRTLGVILREEFTEKLNIDKECYLGLPEELCDPRINRKLRLLDPCPFFMWVICNKLCQLFWIPTTVQWKFYLLHTALVTYLTVHWKATSAFVNPRRLSVYKMMNEPGFRRGETPSANVQSTARGLATVANSMATQNPDIFQSGFEFVDVASQHEETRHLMPKSIPNLSFCKATFNDGGFCVMVPPADDDDKDNATPRLVKTDIPSLPGFHYAWGWFGFNGSLTAFHPRGDFAVAFQPTAFNDLNPIARVEKMTRALAHCAHQLHGNDWGQYEDNQTPTY